MLLTYLGVRCSGHLTYGLGGAPTGLQGARPCMASRLHQREMHGRCPQDPVERLRARNRKILLLSFRMNPTLEKEKESPQPDVFLLIPSYCPPCGENDEA